MQRSNGGVNASTKLTCLIGDPVEHSLSPVMHNEAFKALGLNYIYLAFNVKGEGLESAVRGFRAIGGAGFNITIPHKVEVMRHLDWLDEVSSGAGAVNTVVNKDARLLGYNTDVEGFLAPLRRIVPKLSGKKVVILGSGGAARACAWGLAYEGCCEIVLLARRPWKAEEIASSIRRQFDVNCSTGGISDEYLRRALGSAHVVVNSTSVGMYPNVYESVLPKGFVDAGMIAYDLVYNPVKTRFLLDAEEAGARTICGCDMLVEQGALSFHLWTGIEPPRGVMLKAVLKSLTGGGVGEG